MLANVIERFYGAVVLLDEQHRLEPDLGRAIVAGLREVAFETADEPHFAPDMFPFEPHEIGVRVPLFGNYSVAELRIRRLVQRCAFQFVRHAAALASSSIIHRMPRRSSS